MTTCKRVSLSFIIGSVFLVSIPVHTQFVTLARKIKSMQVDSLASELCQITVSAAHSDNAQKQATDMAVDAITGICHKLGITCTHDEK